MPIRSTTEDARSEEQANADDRIRNEVERTGGIWAQMTAEQRAETLAHLRDKRLAVLREALDVGIAELDAGKGVKLSPEELMDEVFAEVGLEP